MEGRMLRMEEQDRIRDKVKEEINKLEENLANHGQCDCDLCTKRQQELQALQDYLEDMDDPNSNRYIATYLGF